MDVAIIGAGPAGLAMAQCVTQAGMSARVFEKSSQIAPSWRGHYDRLHLHTPRSRSGLPGQPMPAHYPRYPSRQQVVDYLDDYARNGQIAPRLNTSVTHVSRSQDGWQIHWQGGHETADAVVMATGIAGKPHRPGWPGSDTFPGTIIHSADYKNPSGLPEGPVLVVGFGNSGGEIALELSEHGHPVSLSVRGPVNLLPKELFGIPIVQYSLLQRLLPYRLADALTAPILRAKMGNYARYGLQKSKKGPATQIHEEGRVPLIDIGTLGAIRNGAITVRPDIAHINGTQITFADGQAMQANTLVLATGYETDLRPLLGAECAALDDAGHPLACGGPSRESGLFFIGYHAAPNGQLFAIGHEAQAIARHLRQSAQSH